MPLTAGTPNAPSYLLAFDNTGGIVTSVAVANVSSQAASIGYIIRYDDTGTQIGSGTLTALPSQRSDRLRFAGCRGDGIPR